MSQAHPPQKAGSGEDQSVQVIYILYLVGVAAAITAIVGVIWAYVARDQASEMARSHLTYLIRTFWMGLLYSVIGLILAFVVIGFFVLLAAFIWYVVRCVKGLIAFGNREPIHNPHTWWI